MRFLLPLILIILSTSLMAQSSHPRIWVSPSDREAILDKIEQHAYAAELYAQLKARADDAVARHQADRAGFLKALPLDWSSGSGEHPVFRKITGSESDRYVLMPYLQDAIDCGVLYYLTLEEDYARCAADIMGVFVSAIARMERSTSLGNGGIIYPSDHLKEARIFGAQIPIACDFIYPFVQAGNPVYDLVTDGERPFPFNDAQATFRKYAEAAVEVGHSGSNWSVLESPSLVGNTLMLDSEEEIQEFLPYYLDRQATRQDPLSAIAAEYENPGDIWPESLQYSRGVAAFSIYLMTLLDRVYPDLGLGESYPNIIEAPSVDYLLQYPNGETVSFGDGQRYYGTDYQTFEMAYLLAKMSGQERLKDMFGSLIKTGLGTGYDRGELASRSNGATVYRTPLKLLWTVPELEGEPSEYPKPRTVQLPFAGIYLQRNTAEAETYRNGLMAFVGGGHYVHGHASGMNIELYGQGHVLGVDAGKVSYGTDIHENYYRIFAAHNTVIANGASASAGGWANLGINQLELVAMEPMPGDAGVSPWHSFSTTRFHDEFNLVAPAHQERTLAVIRTSATTGYYVDVYRSESSAPDQFHDYVYHNVGETIEFVESPAGFTLSPDPDRYQESADLPWARNSKYRHPGWHFFEEVESSPETSGPVKARFTANRLRAGDTYMDVFMNEGSSRTYTRAMAPPSVNSTGYENLPTPTLVVRQEGEAWDNPFAAVYASSWELGPLSTASVEKVETLQANGIFKGFMVESIIEEASIRQYVLALENSNSTYANAELGINFTGHFGVITIGAEDQVVSLYIGEGESLQYGEARLEADPSTGTAYWEPGTPEWVDTGNFLGWVEISNFPWVFSDSLQNWLYMGSENLEPGSGGWVFVRKS